MLDINDEQFLFDNESLDSPKEKEGGQMGDTDLYYYICHRAGEGGGGPDNLRVKGGMSDQAGRHLAFLRLLLPTCFFRLQENSHFLFHLSIHHSQSIPLFAYFTYTRGEDTGVCKQTYGESYIAVNLTFVLPWLHLTIVCVLVYLGPP